MLTISKINDNDIKDVKEKNEDYFGIIGYLYYQWGGIVLFESGLVLVVNIDYKL